MYLTVPTNWDDKIIDLIAEINSSDEYKHKIKQVYGTTITSIGSGRMDTPEIPIDILEKHINKIHQIGAKFNFLINAPSLGGEEHDIKHRNKILETLQFINGLGVDIVTISIPFLGELINYHFPHIKIKISTLVDVRSVQHVKLLERLGPKVHSVTLSMFVNREFKLLKAMAENAQFELELLANSFCINNCPYQKYHGDLTCWYSKKDKNWDAPFNDYRALSCDLVRFKDKSEIIKSPWIRPEDIDTYESFGISSIKIAGRTFSTWSIMRVIKNYALGRYDGNLWDLIMPSIPIDIDNTKLDGFLDHFLKKGFTCDTECGKCTYCNHIANKTVKYKNEYLDYVEDLKMRLDARINCSIKPKAYFKQTIM